MTRTRILSAAFILLAFASLVGAQESPPAPIPAKNDDSVETLLRQGSKLIDQGKPAEALKAFEKAAALQADNVRFMTVYEQAMIGQYISLVHLKRQEDGARLLEKWIQAKPDDPRRWEWKGMAEAQTGRPEQALKSFEKCIELLQVHEGSHWVGKGQMLSALKRDEEALKAFDKAITLSPKHEAAWNNRGGVLLRFGKYEEAIKSLDKAIDLRPQWAESWYARACAYSLKGDKAKAITDLKKVLELKPSFKSQAATDPAFKGLRNEPDFKKLMKVKPIPRSTGNHTLLVQAQESPLAVVPREAAFVFHVRGVERTKERLFTLIKNALPAKTAKEFQEKLQRKWVEVLNGRQLRGLAADGPIFLVFLEIPAADSPPAVFVRVTSYKDFRDGLLKESERKTLQVESKDGNGLEVALLGGKPIYFQKIGAYAVLTGDKETAMRLRKRQPGLGQKLGPEKAQKFLAADVSFYLHMPALVKEHQDFFKDMRGKIDDSFMQFNSFHKGDKVAEQMVKGTIDLVFQAMENGQTCLGLVDFQPDGLALRASLQIGPETRTGKFLKSFHPSLLGELARLPAEHMAYSGFLVEPALLKIFPSALYGLSSDPASPNYKVIQKAIADLADAKPHF